MWALQERVYFPVFPTRLSSTEMRNTVDKASHSAGAQHTTSEDIQLDYQRCPGPRGRGSSLCRRTGPVKSTLFQAVHLIHWQQAESQEFPLTVFKKEKRARNGVKWRREKFLFKTHKSGVHSASNTLNDPPAKHAFEFGFLFLFCGVLFLSSGWPPTSYTVKNDLELLVFLPPPSKEGLRLQACAIVPRLNYYFSLQKANAKTEVYIPGNRPKSGNQIANS